MLCFQFGVVLFAVLVALGHVRLSLSAGFGPVREVDLKHLPSYLVEVNGVQMEGTNKIDYNSIGVIVGRFYVVTNKVFGSMSMNEIKVNGCKATYAYANDLVSVLKFSSLPDNLKLYKVENSFSYDTAASATLLFRRDNSHLYNCTATVQTDAYCDEQAAASLDPPFNFDGETTTCTEFSNWAFCFTYIRPESGKPVTTFPVALLDNRIDIAFFSHAKCGGMFITSPLFFTKLSSMKDFPRSLENHQKKHFDVSNFE